MKQKEISIEVAATNNWCVVSCIAEIDGLKCAATPMLRWAKCPSRDKHMLQQAWVELKSKKLHWQLVNNGTVFEPESVE